MTLSQAGIDRLLDGLPRGEAKAGVNFYISLRAATYQRGDKGGQYLIEAIVEVNQPDAVPPCYVKWKAWPSTIGDYADAIDDGRAVESRYEICTIPNARSKAGRTKWDVCGVENLLSRTQPQPASGPPKPAELLSGPAENPTAGSERGQPGAGGAPEAAASRNEPDALPLSAGHELNAQRDTPPPADPCSHRWNDWYSLNSRTKARDCDLCGKMEFKDCGERVG